MRPGPIADLTRSLHLTPWATVWFLLLGGRGCQTSRFLSCDSDSWAGSAAPPGSVLTQGSGSFDAVLGEDAGHSSPKTAHTPAHTGAHAHTRTHAHMHAHMHTHGHTHSHTCTHAQRHTCMLTHTHEHTHAHTHTVLLTPGGWKGGRGDRPPGSEPLQAHRLRNRALKLRFNVPGSFRDGAGPHC